MSSRARSSVGFVFALASVFTGAALSSSCSDGPHSYTECSDTIPCPDGMVCSADGICLLTLPIDASVDARPILDGGPDSGEPDAGVCGDGRCLGGETCETCPADCGTCPMSCGDGVCETAAGEDCDNCRADCGPCPVLCGDGTCVMPETCDTCPVDCGLCPPGCTHDVCEVGAPLEASCDMCTAVVCGMDMFCCTGFWDPICVNEANIWCMAGCTPTDCGDGVCDGAVGESCTTCPIDCGGCGTCTHPLCDAGPPLDPTCDPCVDAICASDPFCCSTDWDNICVNEVGTVCGVPCDLCGDGLCAFGETCIICPDDCGPCGACGDGVCAPDGTEDCFLCPIDCGICPIICGDGFCDVMNGENCSFCPIDCGSCAGCGDGTCSPTEDPCTCEIDCGMCTCAHDLCTEGSALAIGCDGCVMAICGTDPFCCTTFWDGLCVNEVTSICGLTCGGAVCGDLICDAGAGEDCSTCATDCGICGFCGDLFCDALIGEDCINCSVDCGGCPGTCPDVTLTSTIPQTNTGSTVGAGNEMSGASCGGGGTNAPDRTYQFFAPVSGLYTIDTFGSDYDTLLYVRASCTGAELACNDDTPGFGTDSRVDVMLVAGAPVIIIVDGWGTSQGNYILNIVGPGGGCGNMVCDPGESCSSCPSDCGPCPGCGNGFCQPALGETCSSCPIDCGPCPGCGNGFCQPALGETCSSCPADCGPCGGCGNMVCEFGEDCLSCPADCGPCGGCGNFWCEPGETCASCPTDCGFCACGNLFCEPGETCSSCPIDCGTCPGCGNGSCEAALGEDCTTCPGDCGVCPGCGDGSCSATETCSSCPADCGVCACGNFVCGPGETCTNCPIDCGTCPFCGDFTCGFGEDCTSCPTDCGPCPPGCPNGTCGVTESCSTCPADCGTCACPHTECSTGGPLPATCSSCATTVCTTAPWCCTDFWDDTCVFFALTQCGSTCPGTCGDFICSGSETCSTCPMDCGLCPTVCPNGICESPTEGCGTCPADCGPCPGTCGDGICGAGETCATCMTDCGTCTGTCTHDECLVGSLLVDGCSPCVTAVCDVDFFCCSVSWDGLCASEAASICGEPCDAACGNGTCGRGETCSTCPTDCGSCACPHDVCTPGAALPSTCDPCVATVCAADAFCCTTTWDDRCIGEAEDLCGVDCGGVCGDFTCGPTEDCATCPTDCGICVVCGDGFCAGSETCSTCPGDCGPCPVCGDGSCTWPEDCFGCPADCGPCGGFCGDFICQPFIGEDCFTCSIDCGSCGFCGDGFCDAFAGEDCTWCDIDCGPCMPFCGDGSCDAFAGEDCSTCATDCGPCMPFCGDGACNAGENCLSCPGDCGACGTCGDGFCVAFIGENCMTCTADCGPCTGACGDGTCSGTEACWNCDVDCGTCLGNCGDGMCVFTEAEFCFTCPADCGPCG